MRLSQKLGAIFLTLATLSSCYAEGFSGEFRADGMINRMISGIDTTDFELSDRLYLSRAKIRYEKEWGSLKRWGSCIEFRLNELQTPIFKQSVLAQPITTDTTRLSQANIRYKMHHISYTAGLIEVPDLTPSFEKFTLGLDSQVGSIIQKIGYHLGGTIRFQEGPFAGNFSVWQARPVVQRGYQELQSFGVLSETITPSVLQNAVSPQTALDGTEIAKILPSDSFSSITIPYALGGRLGYTLISQKNRYLGLGAGGSYSLLDTPIVLAVLYQPYVAGVAAVEGVSDAVPAEGYYRAVSFANIKQGTIDILRTYEQSRFAAGFSMQRLPVDQTTGVLTNDITGGAATAPPSPYIFEDDGQAFGYYGECGVLLIGEGYKVDRLKNSVSGVRLDKRGFALEVGARFGVERTTNMIALMNMIGVNDFKNSQYTDTSGAGRYVFSGVQDDASTPYLLITVDNSGTEPYVIPYEENIEMFMDWSSKSVTQSFKTFTKGWVGYINFYPTENTVCKLQYEYLWHEKRIYTRDNSYVDSINYYSDRNLQFRIESFF